MYNLFSNLDFIEELILIRCPFHISRMPFPYQSYAFSISVICPFHISRMPFPYQSYAFVWLFHCNINSYTRIFMNENFLGYFRFIDEKVNQFQRQMAFQLTCFKTESPGIRGSAWFGLQDFVLHKLLPKNRKLFQRQ